jgi:ribosomal protein S1
VAKSVENKTNKTKKASSKASVLNSSKSSLNGTRGEPQTMDELLKQTNYKFYGFRRGEVVEGIITERSKKTIWVDIGTKTEGLILDKVIKAAKDFVEQLKVGDKVTVVIYQPESDNGHPLLSFKKTLNDYLWVEFDEKLKNGEPIKVRGKEINRGGLVVETKGIAGFIPTSCFSAAFVSNPASLINRDFEAKIIEVDKEKNRLILSEKAVSEQGLIKEQEEILKKIKIGDTFEGEVTGVMPFGLFVKVKLDQKTKEAKEKEIPIEGLVHISEISWEKVDDPSKFYKQKDKVKVRVLIIDKKSGKLNLSIKQLQEDPWLEIEKKYPLEAKVKGEITRLAPFGAFVNLGKGVEGLIHISKIPAEKSLKAGDKVNCFVESIDKAGRKMSLGLVLTEKPIGYK